MNKRKTIANDEETFQQFKIDLARLTKQYRSEGFKYSTNDLHSIINRIKDMQADHFDEIHDSDLISGGRKIENELEKTIKAYFHSFSSEMSLCKDFAFINNTFFLNRKLHQLSHSNGIFKKQINPSEDIDNEIKNTILIHLFLDYYEAFPMYLRPIISRLRVKETHFKPRMTRTTQVYDQLNNILLQESLIHSLVNKHYKSIRDNIAHSKFIVHEHKLEYRYQNGIQYYNINKINKQLKLFHRIAITFATEFDICYLSIGLKGGNESHFKNWFPYLEIYNNAWQRIGN